MSLFAIIAVCLLIQLTSARYPGVNLGPQTLVGYLVKVGDDPSVFVPVTNRYRPSDVYRIQTVSSYLNTPKYYSPIAVESYKPAPYASLLYAAPSVRPIAVNYAKPGTPKPLPVEEENVDDEPYVPPTYPDVVNAVPHYDPGSAAVDAGSAASAINGPLYVISPEMVSKYNAKPFPSYPNS